MNVENLISLARGKISGRMPRYIDINTVVAVSRADVVDMAVARLQSAMEQAILGAQSILKSTCEEYINALYITDDLQIAINKEKEYLETGYGEREMLQDLLNSPKAKTSKDGDKYLIVPMNQKPQQSLVKVIGQKASDLISQGKSSGASRRTLDDMVADMRSLANRSQSSQNPPANQGQKEFRTASEKQGTSTDWVHPGFQGVNQLESINIQLKADLYEATVRILEATVDQMRR